MDYFGLQASGFRVYLGLGVLAGIRDWVPT